MRKITLRGLLLAALVFFSTPGRAQVAVSATVKDANGTPCAGGVVVATLNAPISPPPTVNGAQIGGTVQGNLDNTGTFSINVWPNATASPHISPAGTTWTFTVNCNSGLPPPVGTGGQLAVAANQSITAATSLSTTLSSSLPLLTNISASGAGNTNAIYLSPACPVTHVTGSNCYFVNANTQVNWTCTWTTGGVVTCPTGTFTQADVGKIAFSTNFEQSGNTSGAVTLCGQTTIASVSGSTQATLASGSCTASPTPIYPFVYGTDDSANITTAWNAANALCATGAAGAHLELPTGNMVNQTGQFLNLNSVNCSDKIGAQRSGVLVNGQGPGAGQTLIILTPNFNFATCVSGFNATSCFGGYNGATHTAPFPGGTNFSNFSINGFGLSPSPGGAGAIMELDSNNYAFNVNLIGWEGQTSGFFGFLVQGVPAVLNQVQADGAGDPPLSADGGDITITGDSYFGDSHDYCAWVYNHGNIFSTNSLWGPTSAGTCILINGGATFWSDGDISYTASTSFLDFASTAGTAYVSHAYFANPVAGSSTINLGVSGAKLYLRDSNVSAIATGAQSLNIVAGATLFDLCGNTFTSTAANSISGSVFGECSATGVNVASSNLVRSAGWGTGNTVTALQGANAPILFTLTNGSAAVGANPTITYTFPTPYLVAPQSCTATQTGGTNPQNTFTSSSLTATGVVFTTNVTPTVNDTEIIQVVCQVTQ